MILNHKILMNRYIIYKEKGNSFYWKRINTNVSNFRARIFRLAELKDYKKMKKVQDLMINSAANLAFVIIHISYNSGKKTPVIDKIFIYMVISKLFILCCFYNSYFMIHRYEPDVW
uniref:putative group II intron reverse transcriptase/maturase mat6 n=1 Tax=Strombomonas costata TaxID=161230 RepID=UPI0023AA2AEF|nr:putative group II intron reverse transcriptase/maturase mat6 [Strombomonas costata]WCH63590.1 putative group II intron reverse transcriptase/maturase mat6 [Strombomonas costata]